MNKKFLLLILLFLAIGFTLYSPGMQAPRYCDDFTVVPEGNLSTDLYKTWTSVYQRDMFYRPIEDTITILIIYFFGWDTTLVHILTLLIHLYLVAFIYYVILKLGYSSTTAFCGAFFVLIAQVNVFAVGSNDTISSTLCCCFFLTSLWVLYLAVYNNENIFKPRLYSISLILFVLALFTKEAAVTFFPIFALLALVKDPFFRSMNFSNFKRLLFISIPFLVIFVLYYLFHSSIAKVHPSTGSESYNFRFGLNLIINIAQMLFVIFLPLSSVRVFEAVQIKDFKFLALAAGLTALFAFIIFYGIWKSKKIKEGIILLAFMLAAFFPYVLMNHVNEHYTYYSMLFVAMIVGLGASYFINKLKGTPRTISILFFTIIVLLNCFSIVEKSYQMKETGENADRLFSQISGYLPQVQHGGALVLVNPAEKQLKYSVFRLPGFETIRYAQFYVYKLAGRSDFEVNIIEWNEIEQNKKPNALMLKLEGDKVVPLK